MLNIKSTIKIIFLELFLMDYVALCVCVYKLLLIFHLLDSFLIVLFFILTFLRFNQLLAFHQLGNPDII